ncbi:unnamed protein product [Rotaria sp. Silwood1]|nr:unnamed protein product [Rotaria sp. Silwood1]CAF1245013.1 unnamed protein product [Rotaria sp. Silwood1]CAF3499629.1 unnamed protein product [Rotaria sp. Silwood1]CAF4772510.1 unnamed protein product [Rotaria sp. Silwood1]
MNKRTTLPILSSNGRSISTTPSGRPRSNISSSASIHRINLGSSCSNHIFPCRLPLKKIKPEPWQRLFDGEKRQVYSQQGLTMTKNKQNVDARINEEFFNLTDEQTKLDENSQRGALPPPIQAHIDNLCEQIDDLALQLAEERLNHKQTRAKAQEILTNQLQNQNKQFQELLHHKMLEHEKELEDLNEKNSKSLDEEQNQSHKREQDLKNELEFLKTSFHSYKINLDKENVEKNQIKINEGLEEMKKEFRTKENEMNQKINEAIIKERKNLSARQKMEIENLRKQHQKEIDTIHKTFADSAFDRARVETLTKELTSTKLELDDSKERVVNLTLQLKDLEIQYAETTRELNDFRTRFDEKTKEIEKLYAGRLDQLQLQNADLRNMYMKKCAELVDERTLTQQKIDEQVNFTRKQLQQKLLNIRITSAVPLNTDNQTRRLSTYATASQYELSPTRCRSAFATSHPVSATNNKLTIDSNNTTDFTLHNIRRETKLRRRTSVPITEEEQDIARYLTSTSIIKRPDSLSSKYNFENEPTMIKNLSLEDLQETFKS